MIPTLWKREFRLEQFGINYSRPSEFTRSQWQRAEGRVSAVYLTYRWLLACYFLASMLACICEPGHDVGFTLKWPIYLTNWGYLVYTLQALIGALLVTERARRERSEDYAVAPKEPQMPQMSPLYKLYWVLHTSAVVLAFGITISYWVAVYNPQIHTLSAFNLMAHAINSVVIGLDFCLVGHPFRILHFYWPVLFVATYLLFSAAYFALGGTDRHALPFIYPVLNWQHGGRTALVAVVGLLFVFGVHCTVWALYALRRAVARSCRRGPTDDELVKKLDHSVNCSNSSMQLEIV